MNLYFDLPDDILDKIRWINLREEIKDAWEERQKDYRDEYPQECCCYSWGKNINKNKKPACSNVYGGYWCSSNAEYRRIFCSDRCCNNHYTYQEYNLTPERFIDSYEMNGEGLMDEHLYSGAGFIR